MYLHVGVGDGLNLRPAGVLRMAEYVSVSDRKKVREIWDGKEVRVSVVGGSRVTVGLVASTNMFKLRCTMIVLS